MRCNSWMRVGTAGAIGMSIFVCAGAEANTRPPSTREHGSQPAAHAAPSTRTASLKTTIGRESSIAFAPQITPWQQLTVEPGDSLSQLFKRAGLKAREWVALLDIGSDAEPLKTLQPGETIQIRKTPSGQLAELRYKLDAVDTLAITRDSRTENADDLRAAVVHLDSSTRRQTASGTVDGSLSGSLAAAGVPPRVATQLANIYRYRADLSRNMHPGDHFSVIYESEFVANERVASGPIIAASITTGGRVMQAFRDLDDEGESAYYDTDGRPYKPSFSRHPVDYSRISSPFDPDRLHPILHIRRPHWGVDMAAPRGTPIHAAANGTVKFAGRKHGYGRVVELTHFDGYTSRYGHMYKVAKGLHDGEDVHQGQVIGYVGSTGEATGPHLHFEIRKDGVAHNPLTMPLPDGKPLDAKRLATFTSRIQPLVARLDATSGIPDTLIAANGKMGVNARQSCAGASAVNAALALAPGNALNHHSLTDLFCVAASQSKT